MSDSGDYRKGNKTRLQGSRWRYKRRAPEGLLNWRNKIAAVKDSGISVRNEESSETISSTTSEITEQMDSASEQETISIPTSEIQEQMDSTPQKDFKTVRQQSEVQDQAASPSQQCTFQVEGRRIVELDSFLNKLKEISNHSQAFECRLTNLNLVKECRSGLNSLLTFKCNFCNATFNISTNDSEKVDINMEATNGFVSIGSGYEHMQDVFTHMSIPCMSQKTFQKNHNALCDIFEKSAWSEMKAAAEEEKKLAIENGDVGIDGVPEITVVCDGSWAKRSYRTQYNSLSGMAAIIGYRTKKILFVGIKNKYCTICSRADNLEISPKNHVCYKNWTGSSSSMEAEVLCEGFVNSEDMYGLRYIKMIADGDSSCYQKILNARPYGHRIVEKIECRNHLLRNFCNKLRKLCETSGFGTPVLRKQIQGNILRYRSYICKAIDYRKKYCDIQEEGAVELKKDIRNVLSHCCGEHLHCQTLQYFCKKTEPDEKNTIPALRKANMLAKLMEPFHFLAVHAKSLIYDFDNNCVEQFNSVICKFIGGKRINYTQRRSYQGRVHAAVVAYNTKTPLKTFYKCVTGQSPRFSIHRKYEQRKRSKRIRKEPHIRKKLFEPRQEPGPDYGPCCNKPDMPVEEFKEAQVRFLNALTMSSDEIAELEKRTRQQSSSVEWREMRRKMLTASNFGIVCKRRTTSKPSVLVNSLLYREAFSTKATEYGTLNEDVARRALEKAKEIEIEPCGLFIDHCKAYLGASPDGVIGKSGIVEIKCPFSAKTLTPEAAIAQKKITFWKLQSDGTFAVNKRHNWYYQVQGQLHVTRRKYCIVAVWTPLGLKTEIVMRDDSFWKTQMENKLEIFYMKWMLPELVDPRKSRNMPLRD